MSVVLCTREEQESSLAHGLVLCTQEQAEDYLMHWRTRGSKNGQRRWQDEQGRLTPAGYQHYAEMYGWNKRVKKAESLQNKADKANENATSAVRRSDEAVVKAYNATRKNERKPNDRRQAKADKLNAESERRKVLAAQSKLDAMNAQKRAVDYANKLQRKEDKMSKYVDDKGNLTEEAQNKYTYATSNPGEKKMSLLGRIKFGNEYSNKFNKEHKMQMTKDEYKEWEKNENDKFNTVIQKEKRGAELNNIAKKFDSLSPEEKKKQGTEILKYCQDRIDEMYNRFANKEKLDHDDYVQYNKLQEWITNRVYDKSGSWNGEYFTGENASKVYPKVDKAVHDLWNREDEIKKEIGFNQKNSPLNSNWLKPTDTKSEIFKYNKAEQDRLYRALKEDSIWQSLNEASKKADGDLCGAILKDIGFQDTPENRSLIFQFAYLD